MSSQPRTNIERVFLSPRARGAVLAGGSEKRDGVMNDSMVRVELHRQFASHYAFEKNGLRTSFTAGRVAIETTEGQVVADHSVLVRAAGLLVGGAGALAGGRPDLAPAQGEVDPVCETAGAAC
jgi:hypothetical protein